MHDLRKLKKSNYRLVYVEIFGTNLMNFVKFFFFFFLQRGGSKVAFVEITSRKQFWSFQLIDHLVQLIQECLMNEFDRVSLLIRGIERVKWRCRYVSADGLTRFLREENLVFTCTLRNSILTIRIADEMTRTSIAIKLCTWLIYFDSFWNSLSIQARNRKTNAFICLFHNNYFNWSRNLTFDDI